MARIEPLTPSAKAFLDEWRSPLPFVNAHTSGSTGKPKEIRLLKNDMRLSARATIKALGIDASSHLALPLSPDYIAGKMMIVRTLEADCRLILLPPSRSLDLASLDPVSVIAIVPAQIESLLAHPQWSANIDCLLIGGAPLGAVDEKRLMDAGYRGYVSYGMTETCSHVALRPLGSDIYHAIDGITFARDRRGALVIDGHGGGHSWGRLATNDAVMLMSPTEMRWLGRLDFAINSGGIKFHPEELERMLEPHLHFPFYITGRSHPVWGESVTLCVEGPDGVDTAAIMDVCRRCLPRKAVPKTIEVVRSFDYTSSGKLVRR